MKIFRRFSPQAADFTENRLGAYDVLGNENNKIGSALLSTNYTKQFGYGGIVPLLIGIDNELIINKIILLPNNETGDYIHAIYGDRFIGKWQGVSLSDAIQLPVDVVSGATHTSNAVIAGVRHTASSVMNSDASVITETKLWTRLKDVLFLSLMVLSLVMVYKKRNSEVPHFVYVFGADYHGINPQYRNLCSTAKRLAAGWFFMAVQLAE